MFIPDPKIFHPGSRVKKIPASASNNLRFETQKNCFEALEILSGMFFLPDPDPGSGS
jgi:hypothetical protein